MKVNQNVSAVISNAQLHRTENNLTASIERLSSGYKINKAKDNPAGIAISNKMRAQIEALDQSSQNASDGTSVIQTADGALNETQAILQRMRELSVQAATDSMTPSDKEACQQEIESLQAEVDRIATDTEFNGQTLLDGSQDYRVYPSMEVKTIVVPAGATTATGGTDTRVPADDGPTGASTYSRYTVDSTERIMLGNCVSNFQTSDNVTAANYKFKLSDMPAQATASITLAAGTEGTVNINGSTVSIAASDTQTEIYQKLKDAGEAAGVTVAEDTTNGTTYSLTTIAYGSDQTISCTLGDTDIATNKKTGEDAKISLVRSDTSFSETATVLTKGGKVTIQDLNGFEIVFEVDADGETGQSLAQILKNGKDYGGQDVAATISLEVTDIGGMTLQVGAHENQIIDVRIPAATCESLYITDLNLVRNGGASEAIAALDDAIAQVSEIRSRLGAYQNRLDYAISSLDATQENMESAISRIMDTDMAEEMSTYSNMNVLDQAAISVLTQANDMPQQILQLLN